MKKEDGRQTHPRWSHRQKSHQQGRQSECKSFPPNSLPPSSKPSTLCRPPPSHRWRVLTRGVPLRPPSPSPQTQKPLPSGARPSTPSSVISLAPNLQSPPPRSRIAELGSPFKGQPLVPETTTTTLSPHRPRVGKGDCSSLLTFSLSLSLSDSFFSCLTYFTLSVLSHI